MTVSGPGRVGDAAIGGDTPGGLAQTVAPTAAVPVCNRGRYFCRTVPALLEEGSGHLELILPGNASTDHTPSPTKRRVLRGGLKRSVLRAGWRAPQTSGGAMLLVCSAVRRTEKR